MRGRAGDARLYVLFFAPVLGLARGRARTNPAGMQEPFRIASSDPDVPLADTPPKQRFHLGMVAKVTAEMIVVGLLPLILFGVITLHQQGDRLRGEARTSMQSNAEQIALQVDEW